MADILDGVNQQKGGENVSINTSNPNKELVASLKEKLGSVSPSSLGKSCCIYRVHDKFRKINEYAYTPEMISIGPFHHGKIGLRAMEDHKLRYMQMLLSQTTMPDIKLEECVESISRLEEKARKCYSVPVDFDSKEFIEMMVVDGLFIIELFGKSAGVLKAERDDTIFNNIWCMPSLVRDMVLLENQLPMLVLDCLFEIVNENLQERLLNDLALHFFDPLMKREKVVIQKYFGIRGKHLLDLLRKTFKPQGAKYIRSVAEVRKQETKHIPSATELRQAGVRFKKGSTTGSFVDIEFVDGVLVIPPILVQDQTDTLLQNLIAAEQCCDGRSSSMTSYAFLMDSLINSPADVGLLRHHGIITNYLGDDEDVSFLFNKLCREVTLVNFYYSDLCVQVNEYYKGRWHVWQATLKRDYFHNPWAIFSFVGAILLLVLTFIATIFAMLVFFIPNNS